MFAKGRKLRTELRCCLFNLHIAEGAIDHANRSLGQWRAWQQERQPERTPDDHQLTFCQSFGAHIYIY